MSVANASSAWATAHEEPSELQLLPTYLRHEMDVASVGTRAALADLDELADASSAEANLLLSISGIGVDFKKRTGRLRNRAVGPASCGGGVLYKDKQSLLGTLERNAFALEFASPELCEDYDVVKQAVSKDGRSLQYAAPSLRGDKEIVLLAMHNSGASAFKFACEELRYEKQFVLSAVSLDGLALQHVLPELMDDDDVVKAAVSRSKNALGVLAFASCRLRTAINISKADALARFEGAPAQVRDFPQYYFDKEFIYDACCRNVEVFKEVEHFHDDDDLLRRLGCSCPHALQYASKQAMLRLLEKHPLYLKHASEELRADYDVVFCAVSVDGRALDYAAQCFQADRELVIKAMQKSRGAAIMYSSVELQRDPLLALHAVSLNGMNLAHLPIELQDNDEVVHMAISIAPQAVRYCSARLRTALEISWVDALARFSQSPAEIRNFPQYCNDERFIIEVSCLNAAVFGQVAERFRDNDDLVRLLAIKDPGAVHYASERLRTGWMTWANFMLIPCEDFISRRSIPWANCEEESRSFPLQQTIGSPYVGAACFDVALTFSGTQLQCNCKTFSKPFQILATGYPQVTRPSMNLRICIVSERKKKQQILRRAVPQYIQVFVGGVAEDATEGRSPVPLGLAEGATECRSPMPLQFFMSVGAASEVPRFRGPLFHDFASRFWTGMQEDTFTWSVRDIDTVFVLVRIIPWSMRQPPSGLG